MSFICLFHSLYMHIMKLFEIPYLPPHIQIKKRKKKKNSLKSLHLVKTSLIKYFSFSQIQNIIILYII